MKSKLLVIGLDGATWNIIKPLTEKGVLPNLRRLMKGGVVGGLESSVPPITYPAWKCYSTGKNPGKLGVYNMMEFDRDKMSFKTNSSLSFRSREIWDYLGGNSKKVGVYDMPTTFPPKKVNGFMISGAGPLLLNGPFTYPPELEGVVKEKGFEIDNSLYGFDLENRGEDFLISELKRKVENRFRVFMSLLSEGYKDTDFIHFTLFQTDPFQHFFWDKSEKLEDFWVFVDGKIGELVNFMGSEWSVFLMSDHGMSPLKKVFYVNKWLEKNGFLGIKKSKVVMPLLGGVRRLGLNAENILYLMQKTGLAKIVGIIPPKIKAKIPNKQGNIRLEGLVNNLDESSRAIGFSLAVYFLKGKPEGIVDKLRNVVDDETNEKIFKAVYTKEDIYGRSPAGNPPDLVLVPNEGYWVESTLPVDDNVFGSSWDLRKADHNMSGIFLAYGKDIKRGMEIEGARIYDLAPTILHMFGLSVPDDMDGRVLKEIFLEDSEPSEREVKYSRSTTERENIRDRIRNLKEMKRL